MAAPLIPSLNVESFSLIDNSAYDTDCKTALALSDSNHLMGLTLMNMLTFQWCRWNSNVLPGASWTINLSPKEREVLEFFNNTFNPKVIEAHKEDQAFFRTLMTINTVRKFKLPHTPKRWHSQLFSSYSFHVLKQDQAPRVIVKTATIYKRKGYKSVYVGVDLNEEKPLAVTVMPFNEKAIRELNYPKQLQTQLCPDLVPPFTDIQVVQKRKGGFKIVAVGVLYKSSAEAVEFTPNNILKALLAAARGEAFLQEQYHCSHSDIKPENIFVTHEGEFQLGDYGLLRSLTHSDSVGTYGFAAPEVVKSTPRTSSASLWEIGVTGLDFMKCDVRRAFFNSGRNYSTLSQAVLDGIVMNTREALLIREKRNPHLPIWIELFDLCASCVRMDPNERPSLAILIKGLEAIMSLNANTKRIAEANETSFKRAMTILLEAAEEDAAEEDAAEEIV